MEQRSRDHEATTIIERQFSIPRYLCQKIDMFGRGKLYATSKRHASLKVRGAECVLLENRQGGLLSLSPSKIRTDNIFSHSVQAWLSPPICNSASEARGCKHESSRKMLKEDADNLRGLHALQAAERDENAIGDQVWGTGVGFKVNSLGFPEASSQKKRLRQGLAGRPEKERQTRPPWVPSSCRIPDELAKQVESYAHQVAELQEGLNSMHGSLRQEEERRRNAEQQAIESRESLSRELVEAQRSRSELRTKLECERQERARLGARLSFLSETVAQGYGPQEDAELRAGTEGGAISRLLNPHELQLVSQLREAKRLRSLAEARIDSLKAQVKELESMCDSVKTYQKVCQRRETAWKYGLLTLVQAALICFGVGIVFSREPIFFGNLIPS